MTDRTRWNPPDEIKIELTKNCPLACIHCSSGAYQGHQIQLEKDVVLSLLQQAAEMHVGKVAFSGGEPLVWRWLGEAVSACNRLGLTCSLYSTGHDGAGTGITQLASLAKGGLSRVTFSLYSPHRQYHEQITHRSGSFDGTLAALAATKTMGLAREIHFVPLRRNYRHLPGLIELAEKYGVPCVSVLRFVPQGRGALLAGSDGALRTEETRELRDVIRGYHGDVQIRVGSPYNILQLDQVPCKAAQQTLTIGPDGGLYPCDAFKGISPKDIGVEDRYNSIFGHSLPECWQRSTYLNAVRRHLGGSRGMECMRCAIADRCGSGCLAQKVLAAGQIAAGQLPLGPDPLCLRDFDGG